jgi:hypothetical protein
MSHFVVLALVSRETENEMGALEAAIEPLLAPYDENTQVEPYKKRCYCVGRIAEKEVNEAVAAKYGDIGTLRDVFNEQREDVKTLRKQSWDLEKQWQQMLDSAPKEERKKLGKKVGEIEERLQTMWQEHIHLKERNALETELLAKHPKKDEAKPGCEECQGTGLYETQYNPKSKWDWYVIAGRWTGYFDFSDYDKYKDEDNYETCTTCLGTGLRCDELGLNARKDDPSYTCNGCDGKGRRLKWTLKPLGYAMPVSEVVAHMEQDEDRDLTPFAIVTEEGWYEQGEMGWWGVVHDEKEAETWRGEYLPLLKKHLDKVAVVVDCHI